MRILLILIIFFTSHRNGICQSNSNAIYFYGYDITRSKVTDPKRAGQDLNRYMLELVGELNQQINEDKMNKWIKPYEIKFRSNTLFESNRQVKTDDIFFPNYTGSSLLNKDSLENMVKSYEIKEASGTGFVIIFEFFSKEQKSVTGYGCIFDIKSRKIIEYSQAEYFDGNSYNRFTDFWVPAIGLVKTFSKKFSDEDKFSN